MNAWRERKVGDLLSLEYGKPLPPEHRKPDGKYPVLGANGEKDRSDRFLVDQPSIVVGRKGSAGEVNLTESEFWPLDVTYYVSFDHGQHDLRFLYYLLATLDLPSLAKGVKPGINRNDVYALSANVPPLPEQRRIVGILDEAFEGIARAKANAEKNLQNARALFESHLQSVFTGLLKDWPSQLIGDACNTSSGGTPLKSRREYYEGGQVPWLLSGEISQREIWSTKNFISQAGLENSSAKLFPPDTVLVAMYGATAGEVGLLKIEASTNQAVCGILPSECLIPEFLYYFFLAKKGELVAQAIGNAQPNISQAKVRNTMVPVPDGTTQREIVATLNSMQQASNALIALYEQKLAVLESLKKSLLHQAFSGAL